MLEIILQRSRNHKDGTYLLTNYLLLMSTKKLALNYKKIFIKERINLFELKDTMAVHLKVIRPCVNYVQYC